MIEVKIPKEISTFEEKILLGLTIRQLISVIVSAVVCVPTYIFGKDIIGEELASWLCMIIALPSLAFGFYVYNGMKFEEYIKAFIDFNIIYPLNYKYKSVNYFEDLENKWNSEEKKRNKNHRSVKGMVKKNESVKEKKD